MNFGADTLKIHADWKKCLASSGKSKAYVVHCHIRKEQAWEAELDKIYRECNSVSDSAGKSVLQGYRNDWVQFRQRGFDFCANTYLSDKFADQGKGQNMECRLAIIRRQAVLLWRSLEEHQ